MIRQIPLRTATVAPSRLLFRPSSFTTTRFLTTETTTPATQRTSTPPPSPPATLQASATAAPITPPRQLSYLVERTASRNFSVYNDTRSGGSKKQTVVKKIVGDAQALRNDITSELGFTKDCVKINPVTGHIKIKGFHADKVQKWLVARGF
ncbi:54S ribosomal protein img2, mitochondrial [Cytospora mali]|uniref:Large ribosomal subunit protein mL49 n=1 Tax=Cytospora mali TaxID=578113 RepID=A0A194VPC2_CYTMA|nr:54S ribosomal protein img2, mitochondrial [Valsa mali]